MPGVDFDAVRSGVSMQKVLDWLGFEPKQRRGTQWRGTCPLHDTARAGGRSFSVNVVSGRFQCFHCHARGNQIELWAAAKGLSLFDAAVDLCQRAGLPIPWINRW